ncbi:hypothetical protein CK203_069067 [Vitis vinifera]|uniref:RRM domain-containing protein n=1 Tax=Vitis vinifera TaxID=29760 RepID=A0A438F0N3_VITVI|nr:hypothetical protein CK203_069067 [Vitis vinifera]
MYLAVSSYALEEEARDYINSVHLEDDQVDNYSHPENPIDNYSHPEHPIDDYSIPDHPVDSYTHSEQQQQQDFEVESSVEEPAVEESSASLQNVANMVQEPQAAYVEEPVGEPPKKTYASILRAKGQPSSSVAAQPILSKISPPASEWNYTHHSSVQPSNYPSSLVPEYGVEAVEEGSALEEGESGSVYVRNLPPSVSTDDIEQEFKNFGRIKPGGVFIRNRMESGVCYAFVEFEDILGVQNAIKASPIQLGGRQVYIEERRANSSSTSRGGNVDMDMEYVVEAVVAVGNGMLQRYPISGRVREQKFYKLGISRILLNIRLLLEFDCKVGVTSADEGCRHDGGFGKKCFHQVVPSPGDWIICVMILLEAKGGGRGRGRGSYQTDAPRARVGGRGSVARGNGFLQRGFRQD